jgi:hypothetical protein
MGCGSGNRALGECQDLRRRADALEEITPAIGHIVNAVRALEAMVGRSTPQKDKTMKSVARELEEATRILTAATAYRRS